jgi:hypothetical protein
MNIVSKQEREDWKAWFKGNWKPLLALAVLGILPFLPVLFAGQVLIAHDQMGSPNWQWFFNGLRRGEIPSWSPFGLGGMPNLDANAGSSFYLPMALLGFILPVTRFVTYDFLMHTLIAGATSYVLLQRYFRLDRWLAVPLAAAYMLNTNFISLMYGGHDGKVHIIAWLPLSIYFLLRALGPMAAPRHLIGLALTVAVFITTSHLQFTYFVLMGYFFVWLYFLGGSLRARRFAEAGSVTVRYWVPVLLGMGLIFFMIYPPMQYNKEFSVRGIGERTTFEHSTSWSMHPEETASLIVPEFGGINEMYWGRNALKLNSEYPGLALWFMGLLGLFAFRRSRWFWLWGSIAALSMIYGLGAHTPFFRLFYEFIPGVKVFRAPSMMLFWLTGALLLMSAETLRRLTAVGEDALSDASRQKIVKGLRIAGFSTAGVLAVFGLAPDLAYSLWTGVMNVQDIPRLAGGLPDQVRSAFALGALRAAAVTALLTWAVVAFLLKSRRPMAFGMAALAAVVVDLYWVNSNFIKGMTVDELLRRDPVVDLLKSDTTHYRVFGIYGAFQGLNMPYYGIETVESWTDNEMRHYRAYRGDDYQNNPNFMAGLRQNPNGSVQGSVFLDMLNVKYVAYRVPNVPGIQVVPNLSVLPRAYFVPAWRAVSDSDAFRGIKAPGFDPRRLAYVSTPGIASGGEISGDSATVSVIEAQETLRRYNRQTYVIDAPSRGVLVIADMWFPFWQVKVDGVKAPLLRVNFAFRGVLLEPGKHEVQLSYSSPWIRKGLLVSAASLICLLVFAWAAIRVLRTSRRSTGA